MTLSLFNYLTVLNQELLKEKSHEQISFNRDLNW